MDHTQDLWEVDIGWRKGRIENDARNRVEGDP
jgi:hypothetical protein